MKVKLVHDYTKYNEKLDKGIIGNALETPEEQHKRNPEDNFVKVSFEGVTAVDVLWKGLEIVDEDYLKLKHLEKEAHLLEVKTAKNVVKTIGPKEGFKKLEFIYLNNGVELPLVTENKTVAEEYLSLFEIENIPVTVIMLEGKVKNKKED